MPGTPPNPTRIYHVTHIDNLAGIVRDGCLWSNRAAQQRGTGYVDIGNREIKRDRDTAVVSCAPGGVVGDYVPFYFAPRSPMLYVIAKGRVVGYDGGEDDVVYLVGNAADVASSGMAFCFTDGHARMATTRFFSDIADLAMVDWNVMRSKFWNDTNEFPDRKRRRQAEFLVHGAFPWILVRGVVVKTAAAAARVQATLAGVEHQPPVRVILGWYYGVAR